MVSEIRRKLEPTYGARRTGLHAAVSHVRPKPLDAAVRPGPALPILDAPPPAAPKPGAHDLERARDLKSLTLPKPMPAGTAAPAQPPDQQFIADVITAAKKEPKLIGIAADAEDASAAGDHAALAAALAKVEASATSPALRKAAGVASRQAAFRAEVAEKIGACSVPPTEAELRAYFRTFREADDPDGAIAAYERYASSHYLDAFADEADVPKDKFWVDVAYSEPHPSAYSYNSLWSPKACAGKKASIAILTTEPTEWKQVTEDRELIGGRRLIDCDGLAFLGGALLREALPEERYDLRYVATKAWVPPGEQEPPGHAMAEFVPKDPADAPILVTSKYVLTPDDVNPVGREAAMKMGDIFASRTTKDAYLLLHKAYPSDSYYAGDTLSAAVSAFESKHGRITNPFVIVDVKEEPIAQCTP